MRINPLDLVDSFAVAVPVIAMTLAGITLVFYRLKQWIWPQPKRPRKCRRFAASARSAAIGFAFLPLSVIYRPSLAEVAKAQIRQQEDVDEDDTGDPESPLKHLLRQLRRIRRGEEVERLSARLN
jgi:hypothetical protein